LTLKCLLPKIGAKISDHSNWWGPALGQQRFLEEINRVGAFGCPDPDEQLRNQLK
jgi:hypothetical protein